MTMEKNPVIRRADIVEQETNDELVIYDLVTNKAVCLNQTSAMIYKLCDGNHSVSEMSRELSKRLKETVTDDFVWLAIEQFKRENLLTDNRIEIDFNGLTRRQVIRKVGLASLVSLPLLTSLIAPISAVAQSACVAPLAMCIFDDFRQSNCCDADRRCEDIANVCWPCQTPGSNASCTGAGCCTVINWANNCCSGSQFEIINPVDPAMQACVCN